MKQEQLEDEIEIATRQVEAKKEQYSQAYLLGIKEGRAFLKQNPNLSIQVMQKLKKDCDRLMRDHSHDMKNAFKGERDFWANQIKRRSCTQ